MKNTSAKVFYTLLLLLFSIHTLFSQEVGVTGNGNNITDNSGNSPATTNFTDFQNTVSRTFNIANIKSGGPTTLTISSITFSNANFIVSSPLADNTIDKNQSENFTISLVPTACGSYTSTVTISHDGTNDSDTDWIFSISINTAPEIDIEDASANAISDGSVDSPALGNNTEFGSLGVGSSSAARTFTIQNNGNCTLNLSGAPIVVLSNTTDFTVDYTLTSTTVAAGASTSFTIVFNPMSAAVLTSTVTIANDDADEGAPSHYTFTAQGTGTVPNPDIAVVDSGSNAISDGSIDSPAGANSTTFGITDALTPISNTYTIQNNGTGNLNISSVTSSNPDFTIAVAPAPAVGISGTTTFTVMFTPSSVGIINSTITINNDDGAPLDIYTFTVQGEGTAAPPEYTAYYEDFDATNGGWSIITSTGDTWLWTNAFPVSAVELAEGGFWRSSTYDNYADNTNIVVESPSYDLTGLQNIKISLDVKYKTENNFDGMRILYSISGGAYTLLGASGSGTNWYEDNVTALGSDGWNDDSHSVATAFTHSKFIQSYLTVSDATFSNQGDVKFRIEFRSDGSTNDDGVAFDNFRIQADPLVALGDATVAPANITSNLRLWLKANEGIVAADNTALTNWEDQAYDTTLDKEDANAATTLAPTYRDNGTRNMNYNPVLDFDNNNVEYMNGKGGFYATDYFAVFRSDNEVSTQTGLFSPGRQFAIGGRYSDDNFHEDPSGLGMGSTSARFTNEILSHNVNSFPNGSSAPNDNSYGRAYTTNTETFQNHVLIVNVKSNASRTATEMYKNGKQVDNATGKAGNGVDLNFKEFFNTSFLVGTGRSGLAGRSTSQLNGMLTEIVSYTSPNSAINQQKIQSYLGIKYGVTLQDIASSATSYRINDVDYIDSQGSVIWDTSANTAHNYDIAGIGRDDASILDQRQSRSQNDESDVTGVTSGFLTMALTNTYDTNKENIANTATLNDREFLVWGNNNASLDDPAQSITVDMSIGLGDPSLVTNVSFESMTRVWKVVESGPSGFDVPSVEISIPISAVRTATPPDGRYLMFISATGVFDPTADYRVMTEIDGYLYTDYDFDNTEYITFGWAPEETFERSIFFDPANAHYVDMEDALDLDPDGNGFTVSAWINRTGNSENKSILSKRDVSYTEGYDLKITSTGHVQMSWKNGGTQSITSDVPIPEDEWHQVAVIYGSGTVNLYIDGVLEKTETATAPIGTSQSFFIAAAGKSTPTAHFHGNIDEVRVWDIALTVDQLHYIMNQEIEENSTTFNVDGSYFKSRGVSPTKNEIALIPWSDLAGYYPMSIYTYTNTKDESGNGNQGALKNLRTVNYQTAPLPYISAVSGNSWDNINTWVNGDVNILPGSASLADNSVTVDWNIVQSNHNITMDNSSLPSSGNRTILGLFLDANEIEVQGNNLSGTGNGLIITHYLNLDGSIDLEGESQLIQTVNSDLVVGASGKLYRDQQGTADTYTYNYWSSPVGITDQETNEYSYKLPEVLKEGTSNINFITSGYNGSDDPLGLADYWIWKFANQTDDDYSSWQHVRSTGDVFAGEGFTMKGPGSGLITDNQNYVFSGKPNNGDIDLTIGSGNDYLVGNPYASSIDANKFILDNGSVINGTGVTTGTLYFWEHWGGGNHNLKDYEGGYATYNLSGGTVAVAKGTPDIDVAQIGVGTKTPGRYIPIGQGFFVVAEGAGGTINFNNSQRVFHKESSGNSIFMGPNMDTEDDTPNRSDNLNTTISADINQSTDPRLKIKIGLNSISYYHRQLLVTVDENATMGKDWGYDANIYDPQVDDIFWTLDNEKFVIQGIDAINQNTILPLGIQTNTEGNNKIAIESLENVPSELDIFIHDKVLDIYHDLKASNYEVYLLAGEYLDRFEITFSNQDALEIDDNQLIKIDVYYSNTIKSIVLINPTLQTIESIEVANILGQTIHTISNVTNENYKEIEVKNLSSGIYIIKLKKENGSVSKKVLVE